MGMAYHKDNKRNFVQYTFRIEENILEDVKEISIAEDISINEVLNQSLKFAIEDYKKNKK